MWQSVDYNTASGRGRVRWFRKKTRECPGFAMKPFFRGWCAMWNDGQGNLYFQCGKFRLPITEQYHCRNVRNGRWRTFSIFEDKRQVFSRTYWAIDRDFDP